MVNGGYLIKVYNFWCKVLEVSHHSGILTSAIVRQFRNFNDYMPFIMPFIRTSERVIRRNFFLTMCINASCKLISDIKWWFNIQIQGWFCKSRQMFVCCIFNKKVLYGPYLIYVCILLISMGRWPEDYYNKSPSTARTDNNKPINKTFKTCVFIPKHLPLLSALQYLRIHSKRTRDVQWGLNIRCSLSA